MNLANGMTYLRCVLAFFCVWLILINTVWSLSFAFIIFVIAAFTDFLDGYFARKFNQVSNLGKILDPIADKILMIGVFLALLIFPGINVIMVSCIIAREVLVTLLRFFALRRGKVLAAQQFGKHKTVYQIAAIMDVLIIQIFYGLFPGNKFWLFCVDWIEPVIMWFVVSVTVASGLYYFWVNRKLFSGKG
ncbi:MAG: CDP-diacylglycerol--glycerol-3-phosphate 3-phosphatidyltransferase [Candidatus Omnitrophica bacterium]|nr:CDP-diacylglycerol--glycerol-3-phosphate 3-phosphatidyltransferase [Candidatus Omnitrophota bacterium]MDD5080991.1 CDP-diacylglycerol--glycerol-3-phosphate 3-phosphatidyltransferase [Candidatus Omnitrophota bacterium]MDD5441506.1 CDP-diacylglycerol--glycerol-3-phosphate 3-phosphatidyltransferase [Candidatus Omnitrophota bacterium]